jgi:hypothetical protein
VAIAAKGPTGALAPTVKKGRLAGGWGVRGDGACGGANGYDDTHDALMGGGGGSLKGGDG